jgi:hypothetical protein
MNNTLTQAAARPLAMQEVAQLQAGLADFGNIIDVLFALARAEHIAQEVVDLRGCIEESLLRAGDWDEERLVLDLPERLLVKGNRHLILLLVNNCLGNALFHGGSNVRLELTFRDGVLGIVNTIDAERAATMQGFLHGQNLLKRIAQAMQWEIGFHAGGAAYRVDITPTK